MIVPSMLFSSFLVLCFWFLWLYISLHPMHLTYRLSNAPCCSANDRMASCLTFHAIARRAIKQRGCTICLSEARKLSNEELVWFSSFSSACNDFTKRWPFHTQNKQFPFHKKTPPRSPRSPSLSSSRGLELEPSDGRL